MDQDDIYQPIACSSQSDYSSQITDFKLADFIFCHDKQSLRGIVMLSKYQHIIHAILQEVVDPYYFWVYENQLKIWSQIKKMCHQIKNHSLVFSSISNMNDFLANESSKSFQKIVLIISPRQLKSIPQAHVKKSIFFNVIVFQPEQKLQLNMNPEKDQNSTMMLSEFRVMQSKTIQCENMTELRKLLNYKELSLAEEKRLPNFVVLKQQIHKSKTLSHLMFSMTNERLSKQTRKQITMQLKKLVQVLSKYHPKLLNCIHLQKSLNRLAMGSCSTKEIIRMYTSENQRMYVLLNSFLRGLTCPTEIYYIQPIVKDLFMSIQKLHHQGQLEDFICYRGGIHERQEFLRIYEAVGDFVKNLGFLSTSMSFETAEEFAKNVMYEIRVKSGSKIGSNGFAQISILSQYYFEQQVLFNPLNYFKVIQTKQITSCQAKINQHSIQYFIVFQYINQIQIKESDEQSNRILSLLVDLHSMMNNQRSTQWKCLFQAASSKQSFQKAQIFYEFYKRKASKIDRFIAINLQSISNPEKELTNHFIMKKQEIQQYLCILLMMGNLFIRFDRISEGIQLYSNIKKLNQQFLQRNNQIILQILVRICHAYILQQKYEQAYKIVLEVEKRSRQLKIFKKWYYFQNLKNYGFILLIHNRNVQALQIYQKCYKTQIQVYGQCYPQALSTLGFIGKVYLNIGQYQISEQIFRNCEKYHKLIFGEQHYQYVQILDFLAKVLDLLGKHQEALDVQRKCVTIAKITHGEHSWRYFKFQNNLVEILNSLGKFKEALAISKRVQSLISPTNPEREQIYLQSQYIYAKVLQCVKQYNQALTIYHKIMFQIKGRKNQQIKLKALLLFHMGLSLTELAKYEEAHSAYLQCQAILKKNFGQRHPLYFRLLSDMSITYIKSGKSTKGLQYAIEGYFLQKKVLGSNSPPSLIHLSTIGCAYFQLHKYTLALKYHQKCYKLTKNNLGANHNLSVNSLLNIAYEMRNLGKALKAFMILKSIAKYKSRHQAQIFANFTFLKHFSTFAVKIGEFEEVERILSRIPKRIVVQDFNYLIQILVSIPKFTQYLSTLQQLIKYKAKEILNIHNQEPRKIAQQLKMCQTNKTMLQRKKMMEVKKIKMGKNWLSFSGGD